MPRLIMDKMSGIESHFYDRIDGDLNDLLLVEIVNSDCFSVERQNHIFKWWSKKTEKS